jgi:pimeloyl-ACP methyl ester carboxylesterase
MDIQGERRRDSQQWILDWLVKNTGRVQNFEYDARDFPPEVKSYRMIPRVMERHARAAENMAKKAEQSGHLVTARELYRVACERYHAAQHALFTDDDPEKIYLHRKLLECFDSLAKYCPTPLEVVEIPFEDNYIQAIWATVPGAKNLPTVLYAPGMDRTKEAFLNPLTNPFIARGVNCLQLDGPGQGTSNIRKIRITLDNYERAAAAALDFLCSRDEVDPERIGVAGSSFGSYWGVRIAAADRRVKALAAGASTYGSKRGIFEEASPRFKQVFMYMAGIHDEAEFDEFAAKMVLDDIAGQVSCPTLMVAGEYDALSAIEDVLPVYEAVNGPKELWMVEDEFHNFHGASHFAGLDYYRFLADWLRDTLVNGRPAGMDRRVLVRPGGLGPYGDEAAEFQLPGRLRAYGVETADDLHSASQLGPAGIRAE